MKTALQKFAAKTRKDFRRASPIIYDTYFAHLSDGELIRTPAEKKEQIMRNQGEEMTFLFQTPWDAKEFIPVKYTIPGPAELN